MFKSTQKSLSVYRGDIYYIKGGKIKTMGSEQSGNRPGIIISNAYCNKYSEVFGIIYLTTKNKTWLPTHVKINSSKISPSLALCEEIYSVSVYRLGNFMGRVTEKELEEIERAILVSVGLDQRIRLSDYY